MYSYEDRIRAVTLYIKLGKRTGAAIRQLGFPTNQFPRAQDGDKLALKLEVEVEALRREVMQLRLELDPRPMNC